MRLRITVIVESDDKQIAKLAENELALPTDLPGVDPAAAKQDFLSQADTIARSVVDNQVPALYAEVEALQARSQTAPGPANAPTAETAAQGAVRVKLRALKEKKQVTEADLVQDELPGTEPTATDSLKEQVG